MNSSLAKQVTDTLHLIHKDDTKVLYQCGKTSIIIVPPQISDEERQLRLKEIQRIAWLAWESIFVSD